MGLTSGMLDLTFVKQLARYELGSEAEESAEEGADRGQAAGELGVVGGVRVLDTGVDDGADANPDAGAYEGSCNHRSGRVAGADQPNFTSVDGDRAIHSSLSLVADQSVVVG